MSLVQWLTFGVALAQTIILTAFVIGRWTGKHEQQQDHHTPPPQNLGVLDQIEQEQMRCRDRLHILEGFRQGVNTLMEERHPTRREWDDLRREFERTRATVDAMSRREDLK